MNAATVLDPLISDFEPGQDAEVLTLVAPAFRAGRVAGTREYPVHPDDILISQPDKTTVEG